MVRDYVVVPCSLVGANKMIMLAGDVFLVDGTAYLLTVARQIKFVMAEHVPVRTAFRLSKHLKSILEVCGDTGFRVRTTLMDEEFEKN